MPDPLHALEQLYNACRSLNAPASVHEKLTEHATVIAKALKDQQRSTDKGNGRLPAEEVTELGE